jgi:hypothetical protein
MLSDRCVHAYARIGACMFLYVSCVRFVEIVSIELIDAVRQVHTCLCIYTCMRVCVYACVKVLMCIDS